MDSIDSHHRHLRTQPDDRSSELMDIPWSNRSFELKRIESEVDNGSYDLHRLGTFKPDLAESCTAARDAPELDPEMSTLRLEPSHYQRVRSHA